MLFDINTAESLQVTDHEITLLLTQAYVPHGYVKAEDAKALFEPTAVRQRGHMIAAREQQSCTFAGLIILVPPSSPARRLAQNNDAEIHLLGVQLEYQQHGLGRLLVEAVINHATQHGFSKLVLWTQVSMKPAQKLYETIGFIHVDNMQKNGRDFKVYEMVLDT